MRLQSRILASIAIIAGVSASATPVYKLKESISFKKDKIFGSLPKKPDQSGKNAFGKSSFKQNKRKGI